MWSPVFGCICVVLGRHRLSTPCVSMSRLYRIYAITWHPALLDKKLFFLRDLSQIGTWRRQSNASQGTVFNISEKQLTKRDLAKRQRENKRTRHLGQDQDQDQVVVTKPWGQPSRQRTNRLISLAPVESSARDWFRPGTMSVGGLQPEDAPDSPAWSRFSDSERERKAARDRSRVLDNGTGGNKICHCRQMWWINYNWLVDMGGNLMFIWLEKIQGGNRFHPKPKGSPPKCNNSEICYFFAKEVSWI